MEALQLQVQDPTDLNMAAPENLNSSISEVNQELNLKSSDLRSLCHCSISYCCFKLPACLLILILVYIFNDAMHDDYGSSGCR